MKEEITYDIFDKVDIRVGTVISVKKNDNPVKFIETFLIQLINTKDVLIGIIIGSTYV